jgi:Transposase DDE domain
MKDKDTTIGLIDIDQLIAIFLSCDDFCIELSSWQAQKKLEGSSTRVPQLLPSEIMTILIYYQLSGYKCFQYYYEKLVLNEMRNDFPQLVSYSRYIELIFKILPHMYVYAKYRSELSCRTGLYVIDSKKLPVCDNHRIHSHEVFRHFARRGKSSMGWFYGLKIHLVINHLGEIVRWELTPANVADNNPTLLEEMLGPLQGVCIGDKGYLTKLFEKFYLKGLKMVTKGRKNMKNKLLPIQDSLFLKKRGVIEAVNDILMTVCDIEHTRHRSPYNAMAHIFAALSAYSFLENKPSIILKKMIAAAA